MAQNSSSRIEIRKNRDGQDRAFIAGTRVRVQDIYAFSEIHGMNPDEIVAQLPHLTLGQIHAALSYYFDNRDAVLAEIREDEEFVRHMQGRTGPGPLEQRLAESAVPDAISP